MPVQSETGQQAGQTKLHFSRFEFKYLLPKDLREELETQFQYFVELDPFVAGQPGSKYFVRSLYFDNDQRTHYWEKAEGLKHRKKFRLRTYTKDPRSETPQFLEIKGRHNNLVFKHRTPLAKATGSGLHGLPFPNATTHDLLARLAPGPIREQFEFDLHRRRIKPVTLVDYRRRPYVSKYDPEFRMTFDDSLQGVATDSLFPGSVARSRAVLPGYTILEVKFRFHLPKWFHRLIQSTELRRVSISKFCACMHALDQVEDHG
ncbi:MAG: polyphosphate polymerase domain-containing protein [Planctomycetota bacterium]|nr:polyphosphate polymerase domain-containing protein [Planctomycetota bacterium]